MARRTIPRYATLALSGRGQEYAHDGHEIEKVVSIQWISSTTTSEARLRLVVTKSHAAPIHGSKDAIESIASNLLSSAIKYTPRRANSSR